MPQKDKPSRVPSYLWFGASLISILTGSYLNETFFLLFGITAMILFILRDSKFLLHFEAQAQLGGNEAPAERRLPAPTHNRKKPAAKALLAAKQAKREATAVINNKVAQEEWDRQFNEHLATLPPANKRRRKPGHPKPNGRTKSPGKNRSQGKRNKKSKKR